MTTTKVEGYDELVRAVRKLERAYPISLHVSLFEEALLIFGESQEEVPVDTGRLRSSGLVRAEGGGFRDRRVVIGYGTAYALAVHERTSADAGRQSRAELALSNPGYKPKGAQTGKSKYLEDPFLRAIPGMARRLEARVKMHVAAGGNVAVPAPVRGRRK